MAQATYERGEFALTEADGRRQREFSRAARHSRLVRALRIAIPVSCVLAVMLPVAWVFFNPLRLIKADISVGAMTVSGSKITMQAPKIWGFKRDNRAYVVNATSAVQDPRKPNFVELHDISSNIELTNNGWAKLEAAFGIYDNQAEKLQLERRVHLRTNAGYDVRTDAALIEFKGGHVVSRDPVTVEMSGGTINADGMEILDNGKEIIFDGHVVSVFRPKEDGAAPEATKIRESSQP